MSHVRTQIRDAFVARLAGLATTGAAVFGQRTRPVNAVPPFLKVWIGDDSGEVLNATDDMVEQRSADIVIEAYAKDSGDMEDILDQIALEVQTQIATTPDRTFGGRVNILGAARIEPDVDDSLEKPCGLNRITYPITYFIAGTNPAVAL
jgi:hypothetical protein